MSIKLTRASGAKNTFFIADCFDAHFKKEFALLKDREKQELAKRVCLGFEDFSTDGLLFVRPESNYDFAWEFYNSDGSHAEMCGNAARCATLFFYKRIRPQKEVRFLTGAGDISGEVLGNGRVRIEMTPISEPQNLNVLGHEGVFVNTGVPHYVICADPDDDIARRLRVAAAFGSAGANITFVEILGKQKIKAATFERGVENFTRACGTGAVAAAVFLNQREVSRAVQVVMPGGELFIENIQAGRRPFLTGAAELEFDIINFEEAK